jgi:hypothetical protein
MHHIYLCTMKNLLPEIGMKEWGVYLIWRLLIPCVQRDLWCGDSGYHHTVKTESSNSLMIMQRPTSWPDDDALSNIFQAQQSNFQADRMEVGKAGLCIHTVVPHTYKLMHSQKWVVKSSSLYCGTWWVTFLELKDQSHFKYVNPWYTIILLSLSSINKVTSNSTALIT